MTGRPEVEKTMFRADLLAARTSTAISDGLAALLERKYLDLFPADLAAPVLVKPNLNSNMNALTGNTTDLRLLAAILGFLRDRGHTDVTVAEGTNSGFYRNRISVIARLAIDRLAARFGVRVIDLNASEPIFIDFENGVKAGVAREVVEAAMLINVPKLKTHFEAGMSVCLKNLMGCLVGQENKKKTHGSLAANILNINRAVKPALQIVDGIIAMEGLGPTRGTPLAAGTILVGTDPVVLDLICARLASFDPAAVTTLAEAERRGLVGEERRAFAAAFPLPATFAFAPPKAGWLAGFIHSPQRQRYFLAVRNTRFFNWLCSTRLAGKVLFATGLRQDVFIDEEMAIERLTVDPARCRRCGLCAAYCPVGLDPAAALAGPGSKECINCLYCYCVCPNEAIGVIGTLGFMNEQMRQYDDLIRKLPRP